MEISLLFVEKINFRRWKANLLEGSIEVVRRETVRNELTGFEDESTVDAKTAGALHVLGYLGFGQVVVAGLTACGTWRARGNCRETVSFIYG
jgi:hypothetical protein